MKTKTAEPHFEIVDVTIDPGVNKEVFLVAIEFRLCVSYTPSHESSLFVESFTA
jgi:hypothetical protein